MLLAERTGTEQGGDRGLAATSEERCLGPVGVIAGGLEAFEPELDVADGGFAPRCVRLPPAIGGPDQVAEVAASLGFLDNQSAQVGVAVFEAGRLERLEQLGGDGARRF